MQQTNRKIRYFFYNLLFLNFKLRFMVHLGKNKFPKCLLLSSSKSIFIPTPLERTNFPDVLLWGKDIKYWSLKIFLVRIYWPSTDEVSMYITVLRNEELDDFYLTGCLGPAQPVKSLLSWLSSEPLIWKYSATTMHVVH